MVQGTTGSVLAIDEVVRERTMADGELSSGKQVEVTLKSILIDRLVLQIQVVLTVVLDDLQSGWAVPNFNERVRKAVVKFSVDAEEVPQVGYHSGAGIFLGTVLDGNAVGLDGHHSSEFMADDSHTKVAATKFGRLRKIADFLSQSDSGLLQRVLVKHCRCNCFLLLLGQLDGFPIHCRDCDILRWCTPRNKRSLGWEVENGDGGQNVLPLGSVSVANIHHRSVQWCRCAGSRLLG